MWQSISNVCSSQGRGRDNIIICAECFVFHFDMEHWEERSRGENKQSPLVQQRFTERLQEICGGADWKDLKCQAEVHGLTLYLAY